MPFYTEGFEAGDETHYVGRGWIFTGATSTITSTAGQFHQSLQGRGGSYGLFVEDNVIPPVIGVGGRWIHFWMDPVTTDARAITFRRNSSDNFSVRFDITGLCTLRLGNLNSAIQASAAFNPGVEHWVAIEANIDNTTGQVTVYLNGVQIVQATGDTQSSASNDGWDQFDFDGGTNNNSSYDDIIITTEDEGMLGEHFLIRMDVDGDDSIASSTGVPDDTASNRYTNVDELTPDGGTSYNEFTAGGTDRYTTANLGFTPASVHSVTAVNQAARDGTITQAQTVVATNSSGTGPTEALGAIDRRSEHRFRLLRHRGGCLR